MFFMGTSLATPPTSVSKFIHNFYTRHAKEKRPLLCGKGRIEKSLQKKLLRHHVFDDANDNQENCPADTAAGYLTDDRADVQRPSSRRLCERWD